MTERPDFLDELGRQLQRGHRRVAEQRQRRRHRLAAATVVVALVPVVAGTWRLLDTGSSDQIDATASGPTRTHRRRPGRPAAMRKGDGRPGRRRRGDGLGRSALRR